MFEKAKDPETVKQNISHKPIDYEKLNRLTKDFGKRFTPQQELSAEQAFWLRISNPSIEPSFTPPVIVDVPSELPKERISKSKRAKTSKNRQEMKRQVIKRRHEERYQSRISPTQGKSQIKSKEVKVKKVKSKLKRNDHYTLLSKRNYQSKSPFLVY
ncbi:hypothetical protein Tco_0339760 [Tanacetum coccineum]